MRNKILMGIILLTVSSLALGSGDQVIASSKQNNFLTKPDNIQYYSGLYLGVGIGVNSNAWRDQDDIENHRTYFDNALSGSLSLGYGKEFTIDSLNSSFYLGGELSGQYSPFQSSGFSDHRFMVVPTIKLGYLLTQKTMLYALGGLKPGYSSSHYFNPMAGLGIETMLSKKLSLGGKLTYTNYHNNSNHQMWQGGMSMDLTYHFNGI